jgi:hypothetical protein
MLMIHCPKDKDYYLVSLTYALNEELKRMKRLSSDGRATYVEQMLSDSFKADSYFLNMFKNNPELLQKLNFMTMIEFRNGQTYSESMDINDVTDQITLLSIISNIQNGVITSQVPSDSATKHDLAGAVKMDVGVSFSRIANEHGADKIVAKINDEVIDQFQKYFNTEINAIKNAFQKRAEIIDNRKHGREINDHNYENYYFGKNNKEGTGLRFRFFNLAYNDSSFNQELDEIEKLRENNAEEAKKRENALWKHVENAENQRNFINNELLERANVLTNTLLKNRVVKSNGKNFKDATDAVKLSRGLINEKYIKEWLDTHKDESEMTINERQAVYGFITEISTNHIMHMIEFEKMFVGDRAFYGSYTSLIKRMSM